MDHGVITYGILKPYKGAAMAGIKRANMLVTKLGGSLIEGAPIIVMSISGGKDSLAMWLKLWTIGRPNLVPVHFRTGWDWPYSMDEIKRVEKITGIKCYILDHSDRFDKVLAVRGWPTWGVRWCTGFKRDKIKVFYNSVKRGQPGFKLLNAIGVASNELYRLKQNWIERESAYMPLVDWGITEVEALKICARAGCRWDGHYMKRDRLSCWCCPWQKLGDLRELYGYNKKLWEELRQKDNIAPHGRKFKWNKKTMWELEDRFRKELAEGVI